MVRWFEIYTKGFTDGTTQKNSIPLLDGVGREISSFASVLLGVSGCLCIVAVDSVGQSKDRSSYHIGRFSL